MSSSFLVGPTLSEENLAIKIALPNHMIMLLKNTSQTQGQNHCNQKYTQSAIYMFSGSISVLLCVGQRAEGENHTCAYQNNLQQDRNIYHPRQRDPPSLSIVVWLGRRDYMYLKFSCHHELTHGVPTSKTTVLTVSQLALTLRTDLYASHGQFSHVSSSLFTHSCHMGYTLPSMATALNIWTLINGNRSTCARRTLLYPHR